MENILFIHPSKISSHSIFRCIYISQILRALHGLWIFHVENSVYTTNFVTISADWALYAFTENIDIKRSGESGVNSVEERKRSREKVRERERERKGGKPMKYFWEKTAMRKKSIADSTIPWVEVITVMIRDWCETSSWKDPLSFQVMKQLLTICNKTKPI